MRSNLSVTRVVGRSSRTAAQVTGIGRGSRWRRHRAAWRLIRNAVASSRQSCRAGLIRTFGSPGRFAENGRSVVTCPRSGFATPGVTTRRLADNSTSWLFSNVVVGDRSFDRPSNTQMEPSRPTVLCDPVAAARGSFATLDGRAKPRTRITRTSEEEHLAAPGIGVVCITSASASGERAHSGGGALLDFPSVGGVPLRHLPSARPRPAIGRRGCPGMSPSESHVGALLHGGASSVNHSRPPDVVEAFEVTRALAPPVVRCILVVLPVGFVANGWLGVIGFRSPRSVGRHHAA